jgi:hypothetical protein
MNRRMLMFRKTIERIKQSTPEHVNERIRMQSQQTIAEYAKHPADIQKRLKELDSEWDIERTIEANASVLGLAGLALGVTVSKKFFAIPALVGGFLLEHALQGWCPPVPVLRRFGFRTQREIDNERFALKALRGDFISTPQFGQEPPQAAALSTLRAVTS